MCKTTNNKKKCRKAISERNKKNIMKVLYFFTFYLEVRSHSEAIQNVIYQEDILLFPTLKMAVEEQGFQVHGFIDSSSQNGWV